MTRDTSARAVDAPPARAGKWAASPAEFRLSNLAALGGRGLVAALTIWLFVSQSFYDHAADFKSFYSAGYAVRHPDIPLYDLIALDENPFGELFKLAPPAAVYMVPFSYGTVQQARLAWRSVLVITIVAAYAVLAQALGVSALSWVWLLGLALWGQFGPLQIAVGEGQWDPVFLLLITVATQAVMRQRLALVALSVALAGSIKPYPLALAGYLLARRAWRPLAVLAGVFALLLMAASLAVGLDEAAAFVTRVLPASGGTTAYADNQSLGGVLARWVSDDLKPFPLQDARMLDFSIRVVALLASVVTVWLVARRPANVPLDRAFQLALFVPLSILVIPAAWTHYQAILLVPLTLLAVEQLRHRPRQPIGWCVVAALYIVLLLPNPTMLYGADIDRGLWLRSRADSANLALQRLYPTELSRLVLSYKALGVLLLYGALASRVSRPPRPSPVLEDRAGTSIDPPGEQR